MKAKRRFHLLDCWLREIEDWARQVETARRCHVSSAMMETILRLFPAYPE